MCKKGIFFKWVAVFLILFALNSISLANKIIYVDDDAVGANDGSSWQNAYIYLQDALTDARNSEKPVEIRVAQGIYKPDQGAGQIAGDREASFVLINDVTLSGGYAGIFEPDPNERNIEEYETFLSGDMAGNDIDINDLINKLIGLQNEPTWAENSYHVVKSIGTNSTAVLDGFIITSGHANGNYRETSSKGGGMYNEDSQCTIINSKFFKNGGMYGAGIYNNNSNPLISDSYFESNLCYIMFYGDVGFGGNGGGIANNQSNPVIRNCIFTGNLEGGIHNLNNSNTVISDCAFVHNICSIMRPGAGMYSESSSSTLTNCRFEENIGNGINNQYSTLTLINCIFIKNNAKPRNGGAIENYISNMVIKNCSFINNVSGPGGGAISSLDNRDIRDTILKFENSIFSGNSSSIAGGVIASSGCKQSFENCTFVGNKTNSDGSVIYGGLNNSFIIKNCFFRSNYSQNGSQLYLWKIESNEGPSSISISYSNIKVDPNSLFIGEGSLLDWKEGNIDVDPLFANPGYWDPNGTAEDPNDDFWVDGDYHLKSQAGRWDSISESWIQDDATSPCIDAGDPNSSIGLEPFPNGAYINMGAYGGTREASKSLSDLINFEDFWPFDTGNRWWNSNEINDGGIDIEITEHLIINDFDVWRFHNSYGTSKGSINEEYYRVYVNGGLYETEDIKDINSLPDITVQMQLEYPKIISPNEPVNIPAYGDTNVIAFQGTLEEVLELSQTNIDILDSSKFNVDDFPAGNHANVLGFAQYSDKGTRLIELYGYHFGPMLTWSCQIDGTVDIETFVQIIKPMENEIFHRRQTIQIEADVIHTTSPVVKMEFFYYKWYPIGSDTDGSDGWSIQWQIPAHGTLPITARATTKSGMIVSSKIFNVEVED